MTDPRHCAPETGRGLIRITGADRVKFLQGLITADLGRLTAQKAIYGALLSPQGKYLTDFFVIDEGESLLLDAPAGEAEALLRKLTLFKLRAPVGLEAVELPVTRGIGAAPEGAIADPRDPALGWRLYGAALTEGTPPDWAALRVAHLIPEHGIELIPGESYILEMGFPRLGGVDFRKGCYIGQEVTARMHHKTELRKGLIRVEIEGEAAPGTPILMEDGREAGVLGTSAGGAALAYLRFDRLGAPLSAGEARIRADV